MTRRYLYHWTHRDNVESIRETGLDPAFARGRLRAVWMAETARVLWAAAHVAARHMVEPDNLVLLRVRVDGLTLTRTSWPMVQTSKALIRPSRITGVCVGVGSRFVSLRRYCGAKPCRT